MAQATPTDPLFFAQWGLQNIGQQGGHIGSDINVIPVLGTGYGKVTGAGIRVGVIDDGVELDQPDLSPNIDVADSYDAVFGTVGNGAGNPVSSNQNHGTAVAGIIGAAANAIGGVGVAPGATLIAVRIPLGNAPIDTGEGSQDSVPSQDALIAAGLNYALSARLDVANNSWGSPSPFIGDYVNNPGNPTGIAIANLATEGRGGKGTAVVFANGNDRKEDNNGILNGQNSSRFVIAVAAMDNNGVVSAYSTPGANLLVTAPGGASTEQSSTIPGNGILTTDRQGTVGYNGQPSPSGDDTYNFNGTSAATPFVSGVIALMLQANPNLGYRDIQQILAETARKTDPAAANWNDTAASGINGGGLHFSTDYGFGLVDAHAAVRLAQSYGTLGLVPQDEGNVTSVTNALALTTPFDLGNGIAVDDDTKTTKDGTPIDGTGTGGQFSITLGAGTVEHLTLNVSATIANTSHFAIRLTSPSGTRIVLLLPNTTGAPWPTSFALTTDGFWGENAAGTWTVSFASTPIEDSPTTFTGNSVGTLEGATLTSYGPAAAQPVNHLVYTDDFALQAASQPGWAVIATSNQTHNVLDLAPTSGPNVLNLTGQFGSIGGQTVSLTSGTQFDSVLGGDGNNTIFAGPNTQTIVTGYGQSLVKLQSADGTVLSHGQDTIFAGSGNSVVYGQATPMLVVGGAGSLMAVGVSGNDTLLGGGSSSSALYGGSAGQNVLVGGSGSSTLVGGGNGDALFATGANTTMLVAASGNETLTGSFSSASNIFFAGSGSDLIQGGAGADTFFLGAGAATVGGGGGGDLFVFQNGRCGGAVTINDFNQAAGNRLTLQSYASGEASRDLGTAMVGAAGTTITLSDNTRITLLGVTNLTGTAFV